MGAVWSFRASMGLFKQGKWRPLVSAVINIFVSIWWAKKIGLIGVLLGTTFTRLVTNVWFDPYIVYRYGLKKSPFHYYIKWLCYLIICLADIGIVMAIMRLLAFKGYVAFFSSVIIATIAFVISVLLLFRKKDEFIYLKRIVLQYLKKTREKLHHISKEKA